MKKPALISITSTILIFMLWHCSRDTETGYKYYKGLETYMQEIFNITLSETEMRNYFIIVDKSCAPCSEETYKMLLETDFPNVCIIFVKDASLKKHESYIKKLKEKYTTLLDSSEELRYYPTNIRTPFYIEIRDGQPEYYKYLNYKNIDEFKMEYRQKQKKEIY